MDAWVDSELLECEFPDKRLKDRLGKLLASMGERIGAPIPAACEDWAATKAAYRFFSNSRVDESTILSGHFAATASRFSQVSGPILVLHDTTEFSFKRERPEKIGKVSITQTREGSPVTVCGLMMHSSLVVTPDGLPLGLASVKFWTRKKFKGTKALSKKVNLTRIPIEQKESYRWLENVRQSSQTLAEPERCVHIGDRESDIYELFCTAEQEGTRFLIRTCVDRIAGNGTTILKKMKRQPVQGFYEIDVPDSKGNVHTVTLSVRFCTMTIHPPIGKRKKYPPLSLTLVFAKEANPPKSREAIHWKLITNLEVTDFDSAIEKLDWYAQRWKIETFHKILKSGCQAEKSRLHTAERLTNMIAVFCIVAWRVFWLTMINRTAPDAPAETVFTKTELKILDRIAKTEPPPARPLNYYMIELAKIGGYLARGNDPPPGNTIMWRGLSRLTDIHLGFELRDQNCG